MLMIMKVDIMNVKYFNPLRYLISYIIHLLLIKYAATSIFEFFKE